MGNGELLTLAFDGESFSGTISFDISGHAMEAQIEGEVNDKEMAGNISLQNAPALPFTGNKDAEAKSAAD
jgi:hypothetical protein